MGVDINTIFQIAGVGIIVAFLVTVLEQMGKKDFANWVTLIGFIYILFMVASIVQDLFQKIKSVFLFQVQIVGLGLIATFLTIILKEQKSSIAFLLVVFVGCVIFLFLVDKISEIIGMVEVLSRQAGVNVIYVETILKIIGIAYIAEFGAQITKDAGQGSIASKIELGGKILILSMAIPILTVVIETIISMLPTT
jgi:stage III sporulation protein AD